MVIHKSFPDFILFLYIHMAYADGFFHPSEREIIHSKMSKLYPDEKDYLSIISASEKEYLGLDKKIVAEVIEGTFHHYTNVTFAQKYKVYHDLFDIIRADGKIEESETLALDELKRIIDLNIEKKD